MCFSLLVSFSLLKCWFGLVAVVARSGPPDIRQVLASYKGRDIPKEFIERSKEHQRSDLNLVIVCDCSCVELRSCSGWTQLCQHDTTW